MKRFLALLFEPAIVPLQLMSVFYAAMLQGETAIERIALSLWYFVFPLSFLISRTKYQMFNLPKRSWRRAFSISNIFGALAMCGVAALRYPQYLSLYLVIYAVGFLTGLYLGEKFGRRGSFSGLRESAGTRPQLPAWLGTGLAPMLMPWLIYFGLTLMIIGLLAWWQRELGDMSSYIGMVFGLIWVPPILTLYSCRSWIALGRPRRAWIKLSWVSDAVAITLAMLAVVFLWAAFPAQVSLWPTVFAVLAVGSFLVSAYSTIVFSHRWWLIIIGASVIPAISVGLAAVISSRVSSPWLTAAVTLGMVALSLLIAIPLRSRMVFSYAPKNLQPRFGF
ncbi:hypothetical protein WG936_09080 [Corynebacterium sp. H127]|uniref:hypothetical protein n=1 Tax=Corynebacterium sp. H127 TaxID=3133418 RepID=UPI003095147A